jgi:GNAT superfamily N-acetyltransferase
MLELKLERCACDCYGFEDYRIIPFGGIPYVTILGTIIVDDEEIGNVTMYELSSDINLMDMAYQIPGDTLVIAEHICDSNGNVKSVYVGNDKFVILDKIYIEPEYRNKGYGTLIAKHLLMTLNDAYDHNIDSIILYASMYEIEDCEEMDLPTFNDQSEKLIRFYEKAGYVNSGNGIMIKKKG